MLRAATQNVAPSDAITFMGRYVYTGGASTTISFSNVDFGATDATRRIYIIFGCRPNNSTTTTLTSASIGGVSATILADDPSSSTAVAVNAVIAAEVPTGASGTVSLTFSNSVQGNAGTSEIFVLRVINQVSSIASAFVNEVRAATTSATSIISGSIVGELGGFAMNWVGTLNAVTCSYSANMPINSGSSSQRQFFGCNPSTTGSSTTYTFTLGSAQAYKRWFVTLRG